MSATLATTSHATLLVHAQNTAAPRTQADAPNGLPAQTNPDADQTSRGPDAEVEISAQATEASKSDGEHSATGGDPQANDNDQPKPKEEKADESQSTTGRDLNEGERKQLKALKQRDQEVRRHEQAHQGAAGQYAQGGPSFEFQKGPDGQQYAVGGEVQIDTGPVSGDPQATIQKMQTVRQAALAPAQPSSQDRSVAAQASRAQQQARSELSEQKSANAGQSNQGTETASNEHVEGGSGQDDEAGSSQGTSDTRETPSFDLTNAISAASASSQTSFTPQSGRLLDVQA